MQVAKRIMRYLKGIYDRSLFYSSYIDYALIGFSNSDQGGDLDDQKNTSCLARV